MMKKGDEVITPKGKGVLIEENYMPDCGSMGCFHKSLNEDRWEVQLFRFFGLRKDRIETFYISELEAVL